MFLDSFGNNSINGSISGIISAFGFSIFTVSLRWGKQNNMLPSVFLSGLLAIFLTIIICKFQNVNLILTKNDAIFALFLGVFQVGLGLILYTIGSKTVPAAELTLLSLCESSSARAAFWVFSAIPTLAEGAGSVVVVVSRSTSANPCSDGCKSTRGLSFPSSGTDTPLVLLSPSEPLLADT